MTTEQLKKTNWLNRAFHAEKAAKAWLAKLERDRSDAERIKQNFSQDAVKDVLDRLSITEQRTLDRISELTQILDEVTVAIVAVDDLDMQSILVRHYLVYESWEQVAEEMHYDLRTVQRKHKQALDRVANISPLRR
ncbi:MAG: hypothetical protein K2I93_04725 [Oscillospiraceae bacterium]|nr:hypothetical protein [Oscillospiraceae bacterium]